MSVKMQNSSSDILETGKREKREKREWQAESPVVIEDEAFPFSIPVLCDPEKREETGMDLDETPDETNANVLHQSCKVSGYSTVPDGDFAGVYLDPPKGEAGVEPTRISDFIEVVGRTRDKGNDNWGRLLEWHDEEGVTHQWVMPAEMNHGDPQEVARVLARRGLWIHAYPKYVRALVGYLMNHKADYVLLTDRLGWHGDQFVMPSHVIGTGERVIFQGGQGDYGLSQRGTVEEWTANVAALAVGNTRLMFAIAAAFAAPLAEAVYESGGVHFVGSSSSGKSTALAVAASVYGKPAAYAHRWRATGNGLEGVCVTRNNLLLVLDELGEVSPHEAGGTAYLITNGGGKVRARQDGTSRQPKRWNTLLLSAGEVGLAQHMAEGGKQVKAGQELRLVDISADAGQGLGMFENLHGLEGGAVFADRLKAVTSEYYGTAGEAFLAEVADNSKGGGKQAVIESVDTMQKDFVKEVVPAGACGQVSRVAGRFGLIAAAGELANGFGLCGWEEGASIAAAKTLFNEWLTARDGLGDAEDANGVSCVRAFLTAHAESRFSPMNDLGYNTKTINRAGYWRREGGTDTFYILPEAWRQEVCKGQDPKRVAKAVKAMGALQCEGDRQTKREWMEGMGRQVAFYVVTSAIFGDTPPQYAPASQ